MNGNSKVNQDLLSGVISVEDACQTECVVTLKEKTEKLKCTLKNKKTTQLWLVYMDMVAIRKNSSMQKDWKNGHYTLKH